MKKKILIPICDGYNEMEAISVVGVFRNAGFIVHLASIEDDLMVRSMNRVQMIADVHISNTANMFYDAVILTGGAAANEVMRRSPILKRVVTQISSWGLIGALSSAPAIILANWGILSSPAVCESQGMYKNVIENFVKWGKEDPCVSDNKKQITSAGKGNSILMALMVVELLVGGDKADDIAEEMGVELGDEDESVENEDLSHEKGESGGLANGKSAKTSLQGKEPVKKPTSAKTAGSSGKTQKTAAS